MGINRRFVDLHMHSTASDGTTPPEKLIEVARAETVLALAEGWISEEPQEYIMALTTNLYKDRSNCKQYLSCIK